MTDVIKVGDGRMDSEFWHDSWIGHSPLEVRYPDLLSMSNKSETTKTQVITEMVGLRIRRDCFYRKQIGCMTC